MFSRILKGIMTDHERDKKLTEIGEAVAVIKNQLETGSRTFVTYLECTKMHSFNISKLIKAAIFAAVAAGAGALATFFIARMH